MQQDCERPKGVHTVSAPVATQQTTALDHKIHQCHPHTWPIPASRSHTLVHLAQINSLIQPLNYLLPPRLMQPAPCPCTTSQTLLTRRARTTPSRYCNCRTPSLRAYGAEHTYLSILPCSAQRQRHVDLGAVTHAAGVQHHCILQPERTARAAALAGKQQLLQACRHWEPGK